MKLAAVLATAAACSIAALTTASAQTPKTTAPMEHVTITGCVMTESSYRASHDEGKGGVAGTGIGAENEYVLTQASGSIPPGRSTVGTSGSSDTMSYELSGKAEGDLKQFVGKRVELVGMLKAQEIGASGPTGGPTATSIPGVDKINKDLKLREFEVMSVKPAAGTCK
jgi:hypothetical protein